MGTRAWTAFASVNRLAQVTALAVGLWAGLITETARADVTGEHVVHGDVTFIRDGDRTIIRAADGSIIDYISFDILPWETVQFIQPDSLARVLNRITGPDPTMIQGKLLANGQVYIVNPAGVYFTGDAVVDVGGLYAAAGNLTNSRFLDGVDKFTDLSGAVVNEGILRGNEIHLIGQRVANHGSIVADHGLVTMLAGDTVYIKRHGGRIIVKVDGHTLTDRDRPLHGGTTPDMTATPGVENTGTIDADRGRVVLGAGDLYALAIRNTGTVRAERGDITVAAADGLIQNDGLISASTDDGHAGTVVVQGPSILNSGTISADSGDGEAGYVEVAGHNHTFLRDGSVISAAGRGEDKAHGGEVLVHCYGGLTVFADGSIIDVSGAHGGGHGGFVEVSSNGLIFNGSVRTGAHGGYDPGTLLIDPYNIVINETGGDDSFLDDNVIEFGEGGTDDAFIAASTFADIAGPIILNATGSIFVGELGDDFAVNLNHDNTIIFRAYKTITVRVPINGAHDLRLFADYDENGYGWVSINVPLVVSNDVLLYGDHIRLQGFSLTSGGTQKYYGDVYLGTDNVLSGTEIWFRDTVNSKWNTPNRSLTVLGELTFEDTVGDTSALRFLDASGPAYLNGGLVRTNEGQRYRGPVILGADTHLLSVGGGDIRFDGAIDGFHDLLVSTSGLSRFDGAVGAGEALRSLTTDAPGSTRIAADMIADRLEFNDATRLGADVTLRGLDSVEFGATLRGGDHNLTVRSPFTAFHGDVTNMDLLRTDADGITIIDASRISGRRLRFEDVVRLTADSRIRGDLYVDFGQTLDGAYDLRVESDRLVRFGGDVGGETALASLRTDVGGDDLIDENLVVIDGSLIRADGDILLNPDGKLSPALVATIAGRGGDLTLESLNGDIEMGLNEKLTALGELNIFARSGSATLGDLNSLGDMTVDASSIALWARPGGSLLGADGLFSEDGGADIIAGGSIDFSETPSIIGTGGLPIFATTGSGLSSALSGLPVATISDLSAADFTFDGIVLDLAAPAVGVTASDLATAFAEGPGEVDDRVRLEPFALRPMDRLAIYMRSLTEEELLAGTTGRELYVDARRSGLERSPRAPIATHRLRRDSVLTVLDRYAGVFLRTSEDPETGAPIETDQSEYIRDTLAGAWDAYVDEAGDAAGPDGFRDYLAASEAHAEALAYLDGLRALFREMYAMGLTRVELRASLDTVLGPIIPASMDQAALERAIGADVLG
ncbi:MAG: filamentous hemagglutinin N-terminal domain-containing protein [Planctomycetota bacterium]|nr:filamentous hemagglutinin N-terminal domain-containing protein [Planctomycetota bacterium]